VLVATSTDNGVDALQIRGSISQTTSTIPVENTVAGVAVLITNTFTDFGVFGTKSNHHLGLITNNSVKASITPGGQFNIGGNYTSTNNTLQVAGNAAIGYTTAAPTNGLIVNGNVGIGTASSNAKLHVYSSGGGMEIYPGGTTVLEFIDRNNTSATVNTEFYTRNGYFAWFNGQYTERMRITSGGRTLMGSTVPADNGVDALQVNGSVRGSSFKSESGTISLPTSVNTQFYSFTQRGLYLVKLYLAGGNQSSIWSATAIVSFDATDVVTIANVGGTNVTITVSGTTLLGRNIGSTFTFNYDILRMNTN
jgi:hypothetical protein